MYQITHAPNADGEWWPSEIYVNEKLTFRIKTETSGGRTASYILNHRGAPIRTKTWPKGKTVSPSDCTNWVIDALA